MSLLYIFPILFKKIIVFLGHSSLYFTYNQKLLEQMRDFPIFVKQSRNNFKMESAYAAPKKMLQHHQIFGIVNELRQIHGFTNHRFCLFFLTCPRSIPVIDLSYYIDLYSYTCYLTRSSTKRKCIIITKATNRTSLQTVSTLFSVSKYNFDTMLYFSSWTLAFYANLEGVNDKQ